MSDLEIGYMLYQVTQQLLREAYQVHRVHPATCAYLATKLIYAHQTPTGNGLHRRLIFASFHFRTVFANTYRLNPASLSRTSLSQHLVSTAQPRHPVPARPVLSTLIALHSGDNEHLPIQVLSWYVVANTCPAQIDPGVTSTDALSAASGSYALQKSRSPWLLEEWSEFAVTVQLYSAVGIWSYLHANAGYCQNPAFVQHNRQDDC
ncbi:hypothetical protein EDD15DRAFT_2194838 [Pisolithus albus]|nr:hypothetical protein EDD15DRAFT_2194838 [Pisolithus albus]